MERSRKGIARAGDGELSTPGARKKEEVGLNCGHTVLLEQPVPRVGDAQFCLRCDEYSYVEKTPFPFVTKCKTRRNCCSVVSRTLEQAEKKMVTHSTRYPHHRIDVLEGLRVIGSYQGQADGYRRRDSIPDLLRDVKHSQQLPGSR